MMKPTRLSALTLMLTLAWGGPLSAQTNHRQILLAAAFAAVAWTGCTHRGPKTVAVDRFDYSTAIADSWKQQTLLNIVKLREVQAAGAFGMRVEEDKAKGSTGVVFFRREDVPAAILEKAAEVRRLLKLPAEGQRFALSYSPVRGAENELAVNSRSLLQIMTAFASYMDVPEAHLKDHIAVPAFENAAPEKQQTPVRIHSGKEKPAGAFAAVHYRDRWFWIEDGDWKTKRALTAVMFFFTLAETGSNDKLPLITIPAQ